MGITVTIALVMKLFRQPLIVAYIVAGMIGGPLFLNVLHGGEEFFETFANFGIILLLFIVGLSLNFTYIKKVGKTVFIGGIAQFLLTSSLGFILLWLLDFSLFSALLLAVAITFSSTIIVSKILADKKDAESMYGRYAVGLLLLQDLIAVGLMIFLNTMNIGGSWQETLLLTVGKGILLVAAVVLLVKNILPVLMKQVAHSGELLFIFTITWCFGVASLAYWAGFSVEIGAVIAGISLGTSPYQMQIASRIRPLRDFFIVLFFIVLGSEMQLGDLRAVITPAIFVTLFVLIVDPMILYFIMRKMKYTRRNAFLASVTSAQVSEFGFILVFKGKDLGLLQGNELTLLTVVALATIVISSYLITYSEQIYRFLQPFLEKFGEDKNINRDESAMQYRVWVIGHHRIGWKVCEALEDMNIEYAVIDFNPETIERLQARGTPVFYGDASDVEFLESLPLEKAKLIISTMPEKDDQITFITTARNAGSKAMIIASLYQTAHLEDMYKAGANYVMVPHLLGGTWMARILKERPWTKSTFKQLQRDQLDEMVQRISEAVHL